ncbi:LOG family protein [Stratiformator vulcanicus]|uniref:Cytokinin riboside 5'-monophosphate phosphoribohydrolase n=1 Tax=Stratiformator vulcanicus TaxID=2527980 RepID=A0A517R181_9PLAN|nr:TIGR00730 family Rossman fold protein [Stratiformator vulcanicus]QDT37655.1 LOG family protein YvdD [Stratiformator vulcanicus]
MKSICVYCGSRPGDDPRYIEAAKTVGGLLAERDITLVFGGGSVGMMGAVADACLEAGGHVIGIIPEFLSQEEIKHPGVEDMRIVHDMHQRKAMMAELSDAFITLPGGFGTLEELFETITWAQLRIHHKPIGILNTAGFYDPMLEFLNNQFRSGFIKRRYRGLYFVANEPVELLDAVTEFRPIAEEDLRALDKI